MNKSEKNGFLIVLNNLEKQIDSSCSASDLEGNETKKNKANSRPVFTMRFPSMDKLQEHEIQATDNQEHSQAKDTTNGFEKLGEIKIYTLKYDSNRNKKYLIFIIVF